jgi:hypothetical protein
MAYFLAILMQTFGFGAAASGVSPFSAVAQSSSGWSGWDNQKPATFEKKSLFSAPTKPTPPKKPEPEEKKPEDEASDDEEASGDENGDEESGGEELESQLENGDDSEKPKKDIDMRERFSFLRL